MKIKEGHYTCKKRKRKNNGESNSREAVDIRPQYFRTFILIYSSYDTRQIVHTFLVIVKG